MTLALPENPRAILLDIEGTTTPVSFVFETLFPYARTQLATFVETHWDDEALQADVALLREQALADAAEGRKGVVAIAAPGEVDEATRRQQVVDSALWLMDHDRKVTGLKSLQGKIWRAGYADGTLKAEVFDDVPLALATWQATGTPVYIYSSGSIEAQKLLFGHTEVGDLTPRLSGYFDTTTGSKREADSYVKIAQACGVAIDAMVFFTDVVAEAEAAHTAGMPAAIMIRPGNVAQPVHAFPTLADFGVLIGRGA